VVLCVTAIPEQSPTGSEPVGLVLLAGGEELLRWQNGGAPARNPAYDGDCYVFFPEDGSYFVLEADLGCKTAAAFAALGSLQVQVIDPDGNASRSISYPVVVQPPETAPPETDPPTHTAKPTTTKAPTTAKPTTTKAPTTAKPTTTKAPTTAKPTTTKAPTTAKPTTTKVLTTTMLFPTAEPTAAQTIASTVQPTVPPQAVPAVQTEVIWYTVYYTETAPVRETLWTYAPVQQTVSAAAENQLPAVAAPAPQEEPPFALRQPLLYGAGALLVLLAGVLVFFWLRAQKKQSPAPEDT
jgi:hypothetical protein